ncbi:MAG: LysR family hydrogen peroxide-inducible transcriptional activator [Myxococcota bacterium]|jgi:LysR family hydrogen peroxide-inducible transcriptional activator
MAIRRFQCPDFSLRQLQYAVAVSESGGFGTAAILCGVSQPSLSAQVAKLESALGARLFERSGRGVTLTGAGERLLPAFREALSSASRVHTVSVALRDPYALPVRIAVIPTIAPYLLPSVVDRIAQHPGPTVHWLELQTHAAEHAVAIGQADAMVIADPPTDSGLAVRTLGWEPFMALVPQGSEGPNPVPMSWLQAQEVLLLEDGHCLREHAVSMCMLQVARESAFRATSLPTLVQMVSAGLGISVLPAMAVEMESARSRVEARAFTSGGIGRTLTMAWRRNHPVESVLEEVADHIERAVQGTVGGSA